MIITVIEENGTRREVTLEGGAVRVGRSRECQIYISDPALSRFHAELIPDGEGWRVEDRQSKNGTFVNDLRVESQPLHEGDRITLGKSQLLFGQQVQTVVVRQSDSKTEERTLGSIKIQEAPETALTRILVEAAREIASHKSPDAILQTVLGLAVRATNAERGMIARRPETGPLLVPAASFPPGASPPVISRRVLERVMDRGEALSLEDLPDELASQGTIMGAGIRSILCAPLGVERPFRGVLYLDSLVGRADFKPSHLEVVAILAGMADVVLESASMREANDRLRRMEAQLQAAAEIQRALLPSTTLETPDGFCAAGFHRACLTVGGDLFDFFHVGESLGVMLADVAGKGLGAALLMANLHARWHGVRLLGLEPNCWLERLNDDFLSAANPGNRFISMAFAIADPASFDLVFVSAGHNPALLVNDGGCQLLDSTGPILGILPGMKYASTRVAFPMGSRLVIYSDGVTDQQDARGEPFGLERLQRVVERHRKLQPGELMTKIREELDFHAGDCAQDDDTTITVLGRC